MTEDLPVKIAVQLYTVRDKLSQDLEGTLESLRAMGIRYVEIADTGGLTFSEYTRLLGQHFLFPISAHIDFLVLRQQLDKVIAECKKAHLYQLVIPWIDPQIWNDAGMLDSIIQEMEGLGRALNNSGITLLYHNHAHELTNTNGKYLLDILIEKTTYVYLELDIGWIYVATQSNPLDVVQRYGDRVKLLHLKDVRSIEPLKFTELNNRGLIDWKEVLAGLYSKNLGPWIVEQDTDFERDSLESVQVSFNFVSEWLSNNRS